MQSTALGTDREGPQSQGSLEVWTQKQQEGPRKLGAHGRPPSSTGAQMGPRRLEGLWRHPARAPDPESELCTGASAWVGLLYSPAPGGSAPRAPRVGRGTRLLPMLMRAHFLTIGSCFRHQQPPKRKCLLPRAAPVDAEGRGRGSPRPKFTGARRGPGRRMWAGWAAGQTGWVREVGASTPDGRVAEEHDSETRTDVQGTRPAPGHARVENVPAPWAACRGWGALGAQSPEEDRGHTPRKEDLLVLPHPHLVPGGLFPPLPTPTCRPAVTGPSSSLATLAGGCNPLCPWLLQGPSAVPLPRSQAG